MDLECFLRISISLVSGRLDTCSLGISFVDDIHSLPDSVRLVAQFSSCRNGVLSASVYYIGQCGG